MPVYCLFPSDRLASQFFVLLESDYVPCIYSSQPGIPILSLSLSFSHYALCLVFDVLVCEVCLVFVVLVCEVPLHFRGTCLMMSVGVLVSFVRICSMKTLVD